LGLRLLGEVDAEAIMDMKGTLQATAGVSLKSISTDYAVVAVAFKCALTPHPVASTNG
jgi:hypothetical protein